MALEPMTIVSLPPEILTCILLFLPPASILTCARVNRFLRNLVSSCVEVQYYIHRSLSGQLDNSHSRIPISDRLEKLLARERRWEELCVNFEQTINITFPSSGIYDLTGGIYLLGSASRKILHYVHLPSQRGEFVEWKEIHSPHVIIDMGLCVHEHDLIAMITIQPHFNSSIASDSYAYPSHDIHLHLNQVSSGKPHPEVTQSIIPVTNTRWERPAVGIEIVGETLVLILAYYENPHKPNDQVFVYEWKTGRIKMKFDAPYRSYSGLLFLTEDIILLPNAKNGTLEYWRVPRTPSDPIVLQPFFVLSLPNVGAHKTIGYISCRAEPNPTTSFRHTSRPFHANPHHAIAIFNINVRSGNLHPALNIHFSSNFVFFVHRSSLFNCLDRFCERISNITEPLPVPYNDWGPSICRWFAAEAFPTRWITTTAGQRCVIIPDMGAETDKAPVILLNFNQNDVQKILRRDERDREERTKVDAVRSGKGGKARRNQVQNHPPTYQAPEAVQRGDSSDHNKQGTAESGSDQDDTWEFVGNEHVETFSDPDNEILTPSNSFARSDAISRGQVQQPPRRTKAITRVGDALDDTQHCFENMVYSSLPYTVCSSTTKHNFHGVLLDEQSILGLQTNIIQRVTTVQIFHYG